MTDSIKASAPTRIDFGGSTLDLTPLVPLFPRNIVTNLAISLRAEVSIKKSSREILIKDLNSSETGRFSGTEEVVQHGAFKLFGEVLKARKFAGGIVIEYRTGSPFGAGLGGSSSLLIAFLGALDELNKTGRGTDTELVDEAAEIESKIIAGPTGKQDYIATVRGGLNAIFFKSDAPPEIETIDLPLDVFSEHLIVLFTGKAHFSGDNNFTIVEKALAGDHKILDCLNRLQDNSKEIYKMLKKGDLQGLVETLKEEMQIRKKLLPSFTTPLIDSLCAEAEKSGGALKVCGAGGGGSVFAVFPDSIPSNFKEKAISLDVIHLTCKPDKNGLIVETSGDL